MAAGSSLAIDSPEPGVLRMLLDRPKRRNALDRPLVDELLRAFESVDAGAVVFGSTDPAAFCAGADVSIEDDERAELSDRLYELYERMLRLPVPIVVAVSGHAVGGGAQLVIAGDIRVGGPSTSVRFVGTGHGLVVGAWGLPSLVGRGRAMDLCLSMRPVEAEEALRIGLIDRMVDEPRRTALEIASDLARLDTVAAGHVKRIVVEGAGLLEALERERRTNRPWSGSLADRRDG